MNSSKGLNNSKSSEYAINRRDMLRATGTAVLAASAFPLLWVAAAVAGRGKDQSFADDYISTAILALVAELELPEQIPLFRLEAQHAFLTQCNNLTDTIDNRHYG